MSGPGTRPVGIHAQRRVCELEERLPYSGFSKMRGTVYYLVRARKLRFEIYLTLSPNNLAAPPWVREVEDLVGGFDGREVRQALQQRMEKLRQQISDGQFPVRSTLLDQCNVGGAEDFLISNCMRCACPWCDISSGT